jgi:sugar-specific transcriptional regulator TrmB
MYENTNVERARELLQELGLKEYEAKCFVALTRLAHGTAKDISEVSDVPRTRVYDAVRVLESKGLVEVQHTNPQVFRAVAIEEGIETLRSEYETRADRLRETLSMIEETASVGDDVDVTHEVWALSGDRAVTNRTRRMIDEADDEIVFVAGTHDVVTPQVIEGLRAASGRGVSVVTGAVTDEIQAAFETELPDATVFASGLEWLTTPQELTEEETEIGMLVLTDGESILISSQEPGTGTTSVDDHAVFGKGFDNGLVVIVRRLLSRGLLPTEDPQSNVEDVD